MLFFTCSTAQYSVLMPAIFLILQSRSVQLIRALKARTFAVWAFLATMESAPTLSATMVTKLVATPLVFRATIA